MGWTLALASQYNVTLAPLTIALVALAAVARPSILSRTTRFLDVALIASLVAIAVQLVPLTPGLRVRIAPSTVAYEQAVRVAPAGAVAAPRSGPISVNRGDTALALVVVAGAVVLFWSARSTFRRGGLRSTVRGIAWMGAVIAPAAVVQHVAAPHYFYGHWRAGAGNALPYTPFVNRNDFAGWLIMAIPLIAGYGAARIQTHRRAGEPFDPDTIFDDMGMLLTVSTFLMTVGLLGSLSRSALAGSAAGVLVFLALTRDRMSTRRAKWVLVAGIATVALAAVYSSPAELAARLGGSAQGLGGRLSIWSQTWPMVKDFWPMGSGVGTYQPVMLLYQTSSRLFYISHADNEFLQVLAEGGAPLAIGLALVLIGGAIAVLRQLRADRTPVFWMRVGAATGMFAFAVQNFFEMTLRVPANAVLFATLAAIAMHEPRTHGPNPRHD
jgi:O-antigen ligase